MSGDRLKVALGGLLALCALLLLELFLVNRHSSPYAPPRYFDETSPYFQDEVDLKWISKEGYQANLIISLKGKTWYCTGATDDENSYAGNSQTPLSNEQASKIRSLLQGLPPTSSQSNWNRDNYGKEYHIAFFDQGKLIRYHYPKDNRPPQLLDLMKLLKIESFYQ